MKESPGYLDDDMKELAEYLARLFQGQTQLPGPPLAQIVAGGKYLRPRLFFYCARLLQPSLDSKPLLPIGAALELLHTASLIHDDVVDGAGQRRGHPSLQTSLGQGGAVLYGDYLWACALELLTQAEDKRLLPLLTGVIKEMCLGELQQQQQAYQLTKQAMSQYFRRSSQKTAALIRACCLAGAWAGDGDIAAQQALSHYGQQLGLAFQLRDDMRDFAANSSWGKPQGQDLRQGIFTPPLLLALKNSPEPEQLAQLAQKRHKSPQELNLLLQAVQNQGGLKESARLLQGFCLQAEQALTLFPGGEAHQALLDICRELSCWEY